MTYNKIYEIIFYEVEKTNTRKIQKKMTFHFNSFNLI